MKRHLLTLLLLLTSGCSAQSSIEFSASQQKINIESQSFIVKSKWNHGSADCDNNTEPANDVYMHNETTVIMRQNKCLTFEAPFIYVLAGEQKILVLDTGAINRENSTEGAVYSLYHEVERILGAPFVASKEMLVIHSHGHSDHYQGDSHFEGRPNVQLVKPSATAVYEFFGFADWPKGQATIDLGGRLLTVLPSPGHQEEAITIYDHKTKWLMTGDTLYPGYIYVKDWDAYRQSIDKLTVFAKNNDVAAIMGAHIEMKRQPRSYYAVGATYQPNEAPLELEVSSLYRLNDKLSVTDKPTELIFDDFIIHPMSGIQKILSHVVRWFQQ